MANILNLDFLKEILKNQLKVRKPTPQNVAILFNLNVIWAHLDLYFAQYSILKILDVFPITKTMIYHWNLKKYGGATIYWVKLQFFSYHLVLFDSILWWAARYDGGHHAKWNRLVEGPDCGESGGQSEQ